MPDTHLVHAQQAAGLRLKNITPRGRTFHDDRQEAEAEFRQLRREFVDWQERLYAEDKQSLLLVFQAIDAGGKDGVIRNILQGVNPQGVRVESFKVPTKHELARDFLWRIHKAVPPRGLIGIFNRSHYEDVLVVRVDEIVPEAVWRPRYEHINNFERMLHDSGTRILKFFLHISKNQQRKRFQARLDDTSKNWKFDVGDLDKRQQWDEYMIVFEEMLQQTSTAHAPWYVIPGNQKWYRNLAVMRVIIDTLREMDPQYPEVTADLSQIKIK
ncbi:MAG: polyphosphate kinase 2 family protein [Chloroflexota bacterium]|jgi:PPK2 family polyphosphate:nucleotide phosphotransferase